MPPVPTPSSAPSELLGATPASLAIETPDDRRQLATRILGEALLLGVVGDAIMRAPTPGANLTVGAVAVLLALITLARRRHDSIPLDARWLIAPTLAH